MKKLLILLFIPVSISCSEPEIGKYLYVEQITKGYRIHIDKHCKNIYKKNRVYYIKTTQIKSEMKYEFNYQRETLPFCVECVSDENAEKLNNL